MNVRRIVTGHDRSGKSMVMSDGAPPRAVEFRHVPGMKAALLWDAPAGTRVGNPVVDTTVSAQWVPATGGSNAMVVQFPPDAVMASPGFDPAAAGGEYMQNLPGLAEKFELDAPGMHTTDSIDYGVVLEGELELELDDGRTVKLKPHDVVVQNGTRHAWRNSSGKPATMFFVLTGTARGTR